MQRGEKGGGEGRGDGRWTDSSHIVNNFIDCSQFTQTLTTLIVMRCLHLYSGQLVCCGQCQGRSEGGRERAGAGQGARLEEGAWSVSGFEVDIMQFD